LAFALFLAVLPLLNALLDWPSWLVSRWLGRDLLKKLDGGRWRQLWALAWHAAVDVFFAALFLVGLAALLPSGASLLLDLARFSSARSARTWRPISTRQHKTRSAAASRPTPCYSRRWCQPPCT
jgi:hypothetical protein